MRGLYEAFDEIVADVPVYGDLERAIEQAGREQRRRHGAIAGLAAAAVVAVVVGLTAINGGGTDSRPPTGPATSPTTSPTAPDSTQAAGEQPGLIRPGTFPVLSSGEAGSFADPRDAADAEIDIRDVSGSSYEGTSWRIALAARPPRDPDQRIIAYGIVVDNDLDGRADCQIGINNDSGRRGDFHVWVANLRTHETAVDDGPSYGYPIDFAHPAEEGYLEFEPEMRFFFLIGTGRPCDWSGESAAFYAWSSVTEGRDVTALDYAPDAAWLPMSW